ncbi:hypothetical protein BJV78DRAFT_1285070 [Lactifluus subvellereus]|nr:hypothetical protein BJV78DRAFT_1285070 [Lactifluus subvellereus]
MRTISTRPCDDHGPCTATPALVNPLFVEVETAIPMESSSLSTLSQVTLESRGVSVRFDDECVLIPDPQPRSRMSKLLVKPSSFIFKRRPSQDPFPPSSPHDDDAPLSPTFPRPAKFSLNEDKPTPHAIQRRSSLPPASHSHTHPSHSPPSRPEPVTIPLRPCCPNCFSATESATLQGDEWTERFTRAARRRRSASTDNRPCPPHLLAGGGSTIQWSTVAEHPPTACQSFLVMDEPYHMADLADDVAPESNEREMEQALDHLSIQERVDGILPPLLTRHNRRLSPIPSNNPSTDDISPPCAVAEDVDILSSYRPATSCSVSPPPSPSPQTPSSSAYSTPVSSPTISSSSSQSERGSPRIASSFRIPKGASLIRASADIIKGVSVLGGPPI